MRIGDTVEIDYGAPAKRRVGLIQEIQAGAVTVLVAGAEGRLMLSVKPDRLEYVGPKFWQITMRSAGGAMNGTDCV